MSDINKVFQLITTDFEAFCRICITLPARDWQVEPELSTIRDMPFILSKHQREFVTYLQSDVPDKVVLKCRQRGFSTLMLAYCLWRILYGRNDNMLYLIDSLDKCRSFLNNIKTMYNDIPIHFKPTGINILASNRIENVRRNNTILIKTAKGNAVRSDTYSMVVLDEVAFYDQNIAEEISAAINASCPNNRVWISTPKCEDDLYHRKVLAAKANDSLYKLSFWDNYTDWFGSEDNAKLWRAKMEVGLSDAKINRELDCKFKGAAEDLVWYTEPSMYSMYRPNPNAMTVVSLDLGWSDDTAVLFARDYGGALHIFDELVVNQTSIPSVASLIKSRNYKLKYGIMDSSGKKVDQTSGISSYKQMQGLLGCRFYTRKTDKVEMLRICNGAMIQHKVFIDSQSCPMLMQMLNNYEWRNDKMPHDKYSHIHDSFTYLIYNWLRRSRRNNTGPRQIPKGNIRSIL